MGKCIERVLAKTFIFGFKMGPLRHPNLENVGKLWKILENFGKNLFYMNWVKKAFVNLGTNQKSETDHLASMVPNWARGLHIKVLICRSSSRPSFSGGPRAVHHNNVDLLFELAALRF